MLRQRALERQRGALGKDAQVATPHPGGEVIREPMRLLVGARDHHERGRGRQPGASRGNVGGAGGCGHAKDARFRQMGPKGVDERSDAAITAA